MLGFRRKAVLLQTEKYLLLAVVMFEPGEYLYEFPCNVMDNLEINSL